MQIETVEQAVEYLRSLDSIIIPTQYTYFHHNTAYQAEAIQNKERIKKAWTRLPIDGFIIGKEMSFVERTDRIKEALEYGGRNKASLTYARPANSKGFSIRVIMPKLHLSDEDKTRLNITPESYRKLFEEYRGLGDGRHPKLRRNEKILMFACSTIDEVSQSPADILYGVREQDIVMYARYVQEALAKQATYGECVIPEPVRVVGASYYTWDDNYQFERETYAIPKEKSFNRYFRKPVIGPTGDVVLYELSEFEKEYMDELRKTYTATEEAVSTDQKNK